MANQQIGRRIRALPEARGLSQDDLAEVLGVKDRQTVSAMATGARRVGAEECSPSSNSCRFPWTTSRIRSGSMARRGSPGGTEHTPGVRDRRARVRRVVRASRDRVAAVEPMVVAAYVEELTRTRAPATLKQHLAAIPSLFDWLVVGQIVGFNPAVAVRGPRYVVKGGKIPVLTAQETQALLESIDTGNVVGLRDRALIGVMVFSFARVSAAVGMRVRDYRQQGRRAFFRLSEKGAASTRCQRITRPRSTWTRTWECSTRRAPVATHLCFGWSSRAGGWGNGGQAGFMRCAWSSGAPRQRDFRRRYRRTRSQRPGSRNTCEAAATGTRPRGSRGTSPRGRPGSTTAGTTR